MGAIASGLALHGGIRPFTATFLMFADYMRPAMRLASLMGLPVIYVFTHDSIGVGEDGPTHEPVEHAAALRAIPLLTVIRPADANETAAAWRFAMTHEGGPVAFLLSRQGLPVLEGPASVEKGAYVLADAKGTPELVIIATGSEVSVALEAREILGKDRVRVVSMPSQELFLKQDQAYRDSVLPPNVWARMAVEAAIPQGWHRFVGPLGEVVAIENRYGASAPGKELMKHYGFTGPQVAERAKALLEAWPERAKGLAKMLASE
jgi:transketolase